jgi:apolipoprotein N-acyltransferase
LFLLAADWPKTSRLIAFVAGSAATLLFAPVGWGSLAPILVLPLLFLALTLSPKDAGAHFFWFGLGLFLTGTYWIYISVHVFGNAATWIAVLLMVGLSTIMATFLWIAGWLTSHLSHGEPWRLLLVGPAAWVIVEWLRGWILTGFPWLAFGYAQIESPLAGWAPVLGVYGVTFMLLLSTSAILIAIMGEGRERLFALAGVVLPWVVGATLLTVDWTEPYGESMRTTIIQGGIAQDQKWEPEQRGPTLDFYRSTTLGVADSELVIWPEVAIPALNDQVASYLDTVERDVRRNQQTVLVGVLERQFEQDDAARVYNSVLMLGTQTRQVYRKRHLVPFGEYFPVPAGVREWMRLQNLPHADLAAGDDVQPLLIAANGTRLAVAVCYEDAYGAEQLYAFPEADVLINVSNDAWFGDSIAPHQHLEIARMRALEVGRNSVRATNTGVSAFIGPRGELLSTGKQFAPDVITRDIRRYQGATPYVGSGNFPILGLSFLILGFFWVRSSAGL